MFQSDTGVIKYYNVSHFILLLKLKINEMSEKSFYPVAFPLTFRTDFLPSAEDATASRFQITSALVVAFSNYYKTLQVKMRKLYISYAIYYFSFNFLLSIIYLLFVIIIIIYHYLSFYLSFYNQNKYKQTSFKSNFSLGQK